MREGSFQKAHVDIWTNKLTANTSKIFHDQCHAHQWITVHIVLF